MKERAPAILDHLQSLADTTRSRILLLLDRHELTVSELCAVVQLPQSTVSRHLKALVDSGWIAARAEGTSHLYSMTSDALDPSARRLGLHVPEQGAPTPAARQDQRPGQSPPPAPPPRSQACLWCSAGQERRPRGTVLARRWF